MSSIVKEEIKKGKREGEGGGGCSWEDGSEGEGANEQRDRFPLVISHHDIRSKQWLLRVGLSSLS